MKELPVKFSNLEKRCPEVKQQGKEFRWGLTHDPRYKLFVIERDGVKYYISCKRHKLYVKEN